MPAGPSVILECKSSPVNISRARQKTGEGNSNSVVKPEKMEAFTTSLAEMEQQHTDVLQAIADTQENILHLEVK